MRQVIVRGDDNCIYCACPTTYIALRRARYCVRCDILFGFKHFMETIFNSVAESCGVAKELLRSYKDE